MESPEQIDHDSARRRGRKVILLVVLLAAVGVVLGVVAAHVSGRHRSHHHTSGLVATVIVVGTLVVLVAITIPLLLRLYRRPAFARILQFSFSQRRSVAKALRKGTPIADEDRPVADALIRSMRQQKWVIYFFVAIFLISAARSIFGHGSDRIFGIAMSVLYAFVIPWMLWQRRTMFANYDRSASNIDGP